MALGRMVHQANSAADRLHKAGITATVIDPRTTSPLDRDTILEEVAATGRLVIVDESSPRCNFATDVAALVAQEAFSALKAPIRMVTPPHTPVPFSPVLEDIYLPNADKIEKAVLSICPQKEHV